MQYPPIINIIKTDQLNGLRSSKPSKYPAIEEKSTLIARPALVISLKSVKTDFVEMEFEVALNVWLSETLLFGGAKVLYTSEYRKNINEYNCKIFFFRLNSITFFSNSEMLRKFTSYLFFLGACVPLLALSFHNFAAHVAKRISPPSGLGITFSQNVSLTIKKAPVLN